MKSKTKKWIFVFAALGCGALLVTSPGASEKGSMTENGSMMESHAGTYEIDSVHSSLGFAVKHLGISTTRGSFDNFAGSIKFDRDDYSSFSVQVTIQVDSINTRNEGRDKHLKSADFFDAVTYPTITFKSNRLEKRGEGAVIVGDLTIRDVTKELTIPVTLSGPVQSPMGGEVIGIAAVITINRQDYGVSWSKNLDSGGLVVADNVDLILELEAFKK